MFDTDVLIIGNGAAGTRAAIAASAKGATVLVLDESQPIGGGSTFSKVSGGWGIQALVGRERTEEALQAFYDDILAVGMAVGDRRLAQILVEESGPRWQDLLAYGIRFRKGPDGSHFRARGCFSSFERAYITEDMDNIKESFGSILQQPTVRTVQARVIELTHRNGACWGAWAITPTDELICIRARATILASGGGAAVFQDHLVEERQIGDGYALAYRAGAHLHNMEFIQFMLGLKNGHRMFLPLQELNKPAVLHDANGRDILANALPDPNRRAIAVQERLNHMPFSSRDVSCKIDFAIADARRKRTRVQWRGACASGEGDVWEVVHFAHAFNGGVKIDDNGETTLQGLFAAGEVAAGPHGADRIGGCMMTATQVFGKRAGEAAAKYAMSQGKSVLPSLNMPEDLKWLQHPVNKPARTSSTRIADRVKRAMAQHAMVLRNEVGLMSCREELDHCGSSLESLKYGANIHPGMYFHLRNMILTGKLVVGHALLRKQSLGSHYREDSLSSPGSGASSQKKPSNSTRESFDAT